MDEEIIKAKRVVVYETREGVILYQDWKCVFVPVKGMMINFSSLADNQCKLNIKERLRNYKVSEITLHLPDVMKVVLKRV